MKTAIGIIGQFPASTRRLLLAGEQMVSTKTICHVHHIPGLRRTPACPMAWWVLPLVAIAFPAWSQESVAPHRPNRLARETSPYFRAHADNPIDWYPWGEEALAKAKRENKVIFLSIGYSTCHWCHVMERESFEDEEIARLLNDRFVCIKVDREERPEIDHMYMTALSVFQRLSGAGGGTGWPLTMFLTPEGEPFFGGTYFPPRDGQRGFATGLLTILKRVDEVWRSQEEQLRQNARTIARVTRVELENQPIILDSRLPQDRAAWQKLWNGVEDALAEQFDPQYGGFGFDGTAPNRPKFPEPPNLFYLLDRLNRLPSSEKDVRDRTRQLLRTTLTQMALGGIRDHLAGGFHRYSVDRFWRVPHFEKMLYDNAQLLSVYSRASALFEDSFYREVAGEIATFLVNEMRAPEGGFYAALDADSEGEEGRYYVWQRDELNNVLPPSLAELFLATYRLAPLPPPDDQFYVFYLEKKWDDVAREKEIESSEFIRRLNEARELLHQRRRQRERPQTDTKILAAWNGMAIRAFVDAAAYLEEPRWLEEARKTADFACTRLVAADGSLRRSYTQDEARLPGCLDDYAFLIDGLLALADASGEQKWLDFAKQLQTKQDTLFWDERNGGYFFVSDEHAQLLGRTKIWFDNVTPSGNAMAASNLLRLSHVTGDGAYKKRAEKLLAAGSYWLDQAPAAVPALAAAAAACYLHDEP